MHLVKNISHREEIRNGSDKKGDVSRDQQRRYERGAEKWLARYNVLTECAPTYLAARALSLYEFTKKFQRYRPKIEVQGKIFVFDPIYKGKMAKISPKINKIENGQNCAQK